jgi:hypothetical protein
VVTDRCKENQNNPKGQLEMTNAAHNDNNQGATMEFQRTITVTAERRHIYANASTPTYKQVEMTLTIECECNDGIRLVVRDQRNRCGTMSKRVLEGLEGGLSFTKSRYACWLAEPQQVTKEPA